MEPRELLARNLCAACIAFKLRLKSVDYARRTYLPETTPVSESWLTLADEMIKTSQATPAQA
jgi:hypothetical protein